MVRFVTGTEVIYETRVIWPLLGFEVGAPRMWSILKDYLLNVVNSVCWLFSDDFNTVNLFFCNSDLGG
jgi:hypothetical protein